MVPKLETEEAALRRRMNELAYKKWLRGKKKDKVDSGSSSEEDSNAEANKQAFERWLESKDDNLKYMEVFAADCFNGYPRSSSWYI